MSRKNRTHRTTAARRRRRRKPVLVKAGSVAVKIRQSPLLINGKKYPSYIVDYYANGRRYRERRNTPRKARALADAVVAKLVKGELQALELTGEDRRIYLLALENLKDIGVGLDAATREYADAKKISKNADLREVARFRQRYGQTEMKKGKVPDLVRMLLSDLARDKRGDYPPQRRLHHRAGHRPSRRCLRIGPGSYRCCRTSQSWPVPVKLVPLSSTRP